MALREVVQKKLDTLISIMLTDGVQPSDLADNIFCEEYKSINFRRCGQQIIGELVFIEQNGQKKINVSLRYFYNVNKKVMRIEEEISGKVKILWDRNAKETELINEVVSILKTHYNKQQLRKFLATLPADLKILITEEYGKIA